MTRETLGFITAIIGLAAAITALMTGIYNSRAIKQQSSEIDRQSGEIKQQEAKIEGLVAVADKIAIDLTIDVPTTRDRITADVFDEMKGRFVGNLLPGHRLYVLARDRHNFFLMYPPPQVSHAAKSWSQTNVRLATEGRWELHVCIADAAGSAWLESRARTNDWSGFSKLPVGIETARYITVERIREHPER